MPHTTHRNKNGKKRADKVAEAAKPAATPIPAKASTCDRPEDSAQLCDDKAYEGVARDIVQLIQKHPIPAIAIGIGLGLVFARILRS